MDQSKLVQSNTKPFVSAQLDKEIQADLRRSHFQMGNFVPSYQSSNQVHFYDKSVENSKLNNPHSSVDIGSNLRAHNYVLGNQKIDYSSETSAKYKQIQVAGARLHTYLGRDRISRQLNFKRVIINLALKTVTG